MDAVLDIGLLHKPQIEHEELQVDTINQWKDEQLHFGESEDEENWHSEWYFIRWDLLNEEITSLVCSEGKVHIWAIFEIQKLYDYR